MEKRMEDWLDLRYGMFIHWGLYAIMGRGEWAMFSEAIDVDEYRKLKDQFTAEKFDATAWAKVAKAAGMKYMVMTARHHDGFSLWDSRASVGNFTSMNSAARRDFIREYTDACRAEGLKVGIYYSPMDWRFPGFFLPRMYRKSAEDMKRQCHEQIHELMTEYGKIDIFNFDGGEDFWLAHGQNIHENNKSGTQIPNFWGADELDRMIRTLQPGIVINNRYGERQYGDYLTPEGYVGEYNVEKTWETNMTLNGSWGWIPNPPMSKSSIINTIARAATGNGNLLLNVGPRADGTIEKLQADRLASVGKWLETAGEAIYNTRGGPYKNNSCGGMTYNGNTLYIHVWNWKENEYTTQNLGANILSVSSLTTDSLKYSVTDDALTFSIDEDDTYAPDTIVKVELDRPVASLPEVKRGNDADEWCVSADMKNRNEAKIVK